MLRLLASQYHMPQTALCKPSQSYNNHIVRSLSLRVLTPILFPDLLNIIKAGILRFGYLKGYLHADR